MSGKTLIGIDIGAQGTKAALFSEEGERLSVAFRSSKPWKPSAGVVEEDPEQQLLSVYASIGECVKKANIDPSSVAGIAIDGQMAGIIGIGKNGKHVTPYDSWLDTRCAPYISKMEETAGDQILSKTGCPPSLNHGPKILWWMHERKDVFKSIQSFVQPGGYAAMRLCGLDGNSAFIDKTYLHFSGFADNENAEWDEELCREFSVDIEKLPKIVSSQNVIGTVTPSAARKSGLKPGVPVVAGCGDTVASFLSCGATEEGTCIDVAGTASAFAATTSTFCPDMKNRVLVCGRSAIPHLWHPYAYINGGGMNLEWFKNEIANPAVGRTQTSLTLDDLNLIAEKLAAEEDCPFFIPHLGGRVCPSQPNLRGAWVGLNWNHTMAHLYRAILEGVALEYGVYMKVLNSLHKDFIAKEIRITGGGQKSGIWNRMKADVLGIPVIQIAREEGAPLGSALLCGLGVGLFNNLSKAARQWIEMGVTIKPNKSLLRYYRDRLVRYESLLEQVNSWTEQWKRDEEEWRVR